MIFLHDSICRYSERKKIPLKMIFKKRVETKQELFWHLGKLVEKFSRVFRRGGRESEWGGYVFSSRDRHNIPRRYRDLFCRPRMSEAIFFFEDSFELLMRLAKLARSAKRFEISARYKVQTTN